MIQQLKAIVGFKEDEIQPSIEESEVMAEETREDVMKTRIESLGLSTRTANALTTAGIRTVGGLVRKTAEGHPALEGLARKQSMKFVTRSRNSAQGLKPKYAASAKGRTFGRKRKVRKAFTRSLAEGADYA